MKAIQINAYGGVDVLQVEDDIPNPTAGKGQILVDIYAASINPFDIIIREGFMQKFIPLRFPVTVGGDFAGTVAGIGEGVTGYIVGNKVFGTAITLNGSSGGFADFASVTTGSVSLMPNNLDFENAASLPLVGSSAVQALEDHMKLRSGQKILIHGGAGGIGSIAIQLAKSIGAYVAATTSSADRDYVKSLGADLAIDYKNEDFQTLVKDYDAVFDTVGGEITTKSFNVLKKGGILVSMKGEPDKTLALKFGVVGIGQNTKTNTDHLIRVKELVESGKLKPQVDKIFSINEVKEAFLYQAAPHHGKVVLKIKKV